MVGKLTLKEVNRFLLCGVLICATLYFAREVLIPLTFAIFFAMLFTPLCNRMEGWGMKRGLTAFISVLIIVLATAGIGLLVYAQSKQLADKSDQIEQKSQEFLKKSQDYVSQKLNVPEKKQDEVINKKLKEMMQSSGRVLKKFVTGFFGMLAMFVMVLIFTFLFLLQRQKYEAFFVQMSGGETKPDEARKMVHRISTVAQSYLTGRVISISIFTVLYTIGFLIIGLEGAFLLAFLAALLTIIPYIGSLVGGVFPFAVALVTADTNVALYTLIVMVIVNAIDNYLIEPYVIGGEVSISAFFTILILLIGGLMWGIAGMVLFLPMLGVTKIICDSIPELKSYGYLIGDQSDDKPSKQVLEKLKKMFRKKSS